MSFLLWWYHAGSLDSPDVYDSDQQMGSLAEKAFLTDPMPFVLSLRLDKDTVLSIASSPVLLGVEARLHGYPYICILTFASNRSRPRLGGTRNCFIGGVLSGAEVSTPVAVLHTEIMRESRT